jgi:hypothetical protein
MPLVIAVAKIVMREGSCGIRFAHPRDAAG